MELEYSIIANKPVEASLSWVKSSGEVSVVLNADGEDIVIAMAMMFRAILETESRNGIPGMGLSKAVTMAMKMELERAIEKEKKRK